MQTPPVNLKERIAALQQRNASASTPPPQRSTSSSIQSGSPGRLRDKIAKFEEKGGVPVPRGSFGLGAPPAADSASKKRGELYGNRMASVRRPSTSSGLPASRSGSPLPPSVPPSPDGRLRSFSPSRSDFDPTEFSLSQTTITPTHTGDFSWPPQSPTLISEHELPYAPALQQNHSFVNALNVARRAASESEERTTHFREISLSPPLPSRVLPPALLTPKLEQDAEVIQVPPAIIVSSEVAPATVEEEPSDYQIAAETEEVSLPEGPSISEPRELEEKPGDSGAQQRHQPETLLPDEHAHEAQTAALLEVEEQYETFEHEQSLLEESEISSASNVNLETPEEQPEVLEFNLESPASSPAALAFITDVGPVPRSPTHFVDVLADVEESDILEDDVESHKDTSLPKEGQQPSWQRPEKHVAVAVTSAVTNLDTPSSNPASPPSPKLDPVCATNEINEISEHDDVDTNEVEEVPQPAVTHEISEYDAAEMHEVEEVPKPVQTDIVVHSTVDTASSVVDDSEFEDPEEIVADVPFDREVQEALDSAVPVEEQEQHQEVQEDRPYLEKDDVVIVTPTPENFLRATDDPVEDLALDDTDSCSTPVYEFPAKQELPVHLHTAATDHPSPISEHQRSPNNPTRPRYERQHSNPRSTTRHKPLPSVSYQHPSEHYEEPDLETNSAHPSTFSAVVHGRKIERSPHAAQGYANRRLPVASVVTRVRKSMRPEPQSPGYGELAALVGDAALLEERLLHGVIPSEYHEAESPSTQDIPETAPLSSPESEVFSQPPPPRSRFAMPKRKGHASNSSGASQGIDEQGKGGLKRDFSLRSIRRTKDHLRAKQSVSSVTSSSLSPSFRSRSGSSSAQTEITESEAVDELDRDGQDVYDGLMITDEVPPTPPPKSPNPKSSPSLRRLGSNTGSAHAPSSYHTPGSGPRHSHSVSTCSSEDSTPVSTPPDVGSSAGKSFAEVLYPSSFDGVHPPRARGGSTSSSIKGLALGSASMKGMGIGNMAWPSMSPKKPGSISRAKSQASMFAEKIWHRTRTKSSVSSFDADPFTVPPLPQTSQITLKATLVPSGTSSAPVPPLGRPFLAPAPMFTSNPSTPSPYLSPHKSTPSFTSVFIPPPPSLSVTSPPSDNPPRIIIPPPRMSSQNSYSSPRRTSSLVGMAPDSRPISYASVTSTSSTASPTLDKSIFDKFPSVPKDVPPAPPPGHMLSRGLLPFPSVASTEPTRVRDPLPPSPPPPYQQQMAISRSATLPIRPRPLPAHPSEDFGSHHG